MTDFAAVLVYDGECPYCSVAARALERLEDLGAVSWYDEAAQAFLEAQFGSTPFAMFLVDAAEGRVYAGRAAAGELADRAGMPGIVGSLVRENYETVATVTTLASGRGRDAADYHEVYPLTAAAREAFAGLVEAAAGGPLDG